MDLRDMTVSEQATALGRRDPDFWLLVIKSAMREYAISYFASRDWPDQRRDENRAEALAKLSERVAHYAELYELALNNAAREIA